MSTDARIVTTAEPWEIAARLAIHALESAHFAAFDAEDFTAAYGVFAPDGVLEIPGADPKRGRAAMLERFADGRPAGYTWVRHHLTTLHISALTPSDAGALAYYLVYSEKGFASAGVFEDTFAVRDGAWMLVHRRVHRDLPAPTEETVS